MGKKKKEKNLPIELVIIAVFFLSFIMWAVSQCNTTMLKYKNLALNETDTVSIVKNVVKKETTAIPVVDSTLNKKKPIDTSRQLQTIVKTVTQQYTPLYVAEDSLKLRTGPGLQYPFIMKLPLHQELSFLYEVSDTTQNLNIGGKVVSEPWIKVQHPQGKTGWVYGGYINYYIKTEVISD